MTVATVTTTIPYVNARPHVGFALELVQADVLARFHRLLGDDTFLLTGTDDNAGKNVAAASAAGESIQAFCDRHASHFESLARALKVSSDGFIRTASEAHHWGASRFFEACERRDIYKKAYEGFYCPGCEDFLLEREIPDGRCPAHGDVVQPVSEENWFFGLSGYGDRLHELIASDTYAITPRTRKQEALGFIRGGLVDFSISRPRERTGGWGVPVPGDPGQVLYVWFDALTNYVNGVGYGADAEEFDRRWTREGRITHVCGKDVLKFHAIYWPALLWSAGLPVPHRLHVHGHLTVNGRKISKSLGNAVDPVPVVADLGADALRYYLLRCIPAGGDSDFSHTRLLATYNADLANGLGNLLSRLETLAERSECLLEPFSPADDDPLVATTWRLLQNGEHHRALAGLWRAVGRLNQEIERARPWEALRDVDRAPLHAWVRAWADRIRRFAYILGPFLPDTAAAILTRLSGPRVQRGRPLFPRRQPTSEPT